MVHAGHLVDPARGQVLADRRITIRDGRIADIAPWTPPAGNAPVLDWSDRWVLPGLIDMHTHIGDGYAEADDPAAPLTRDPAAQAAEAARMAEATLRAGFTTVRDVGVYRALADVRLRDAIAAGAVTGPRMIVAGGYVTKPGGGGAVTGLKPGQSVPPEFRVGYATDPASARAAVRRLVAGGADVIKLIATGAVLAVGSDVNALEMSPETMRAACGEARRLGRFCIAHAHSAAGIKAAMAAGARSIEHASLIDDEGITMAKARGVWLDMDIYDGDWIAEEGRKAGWPAEYLAKNDATTAAQRQGFARAVKAGARLTFGTDAGVYPHGLNARQFRYMVRYGMTPMQAIRAATTEAAALLDRPELGGVAPGQMADLVAVAADPLADIGALEQVVGVVKEGRPVSP